MMKLQIRRAIGPVIAAMAIGLVGPTVVKASLVTVNFSGTVTSIDDPSGYITGAKIGDTFSGTVVYDTSLAPDVPGANPETYTYLHTTTPPFATPLGITVTLDGHTFASDGAGLMQITVQNDLAGKPFPDVFGAVADVSLGGGTHTLAGFALGDSTGKALSSTALPTGIDLSQWTVGDFNLTNPTSATNIFAGTVNLNSVPEPASVMLLSLGMLGAVAARLRRGH
jgi:hypothetical protein